MNLLSHESSNAKLSKNAEQGSGYETYILYLAPANTVAGIEMCGGRSAGCTKACLFTSGRATVFASIIAARIRKTELFRDDRAEFMRQLVADLKSAVKRGLKNGVKVAVRLNGTSDVPWETIMVDGANVMDLFPTVQFYDYTKLPARGGGKNWPPNYHLTYSRSEVNDVAMSRVASSGRNVAVVFQDKLPAEWYGRPVIDGTQHDMRFLDPAGVVVGLVQKGRAADDTSGFVVRTKEAA